MPPPPNMQKMLRQMQKMQQDVEAAQQALKEETVQASAGGGVVSVTVTGDLVLKDVRIDPEAVDPDDVELLQDLVLAAVNEALRMAQDLAATKLEAATGGMAGLGGAGGLGGLLGGM